HYKKVRQELDKNGLACTTVTICTPDANPIDADAAVRQKGHEHHKWAIEMTAILGGPLVMRSEEHTSELQSQSNLVCRLPLEKKNSDKLLDLVGLGGKAAAYNGTDTRDYLAAAFTELNAWERAGADASSAGMVDAGFENQKELTKMQLDNKKEIAEMQHETQKEFFFFMSPPPRKSTLFPYTTLFR